VSRSRRSIRYRIFRFRRRDPIPRDQATRPLIDGAAAFRRTHQAIEAARSRIWLTPMFIMPAFRLADLALRLDAVT
jgi:phosphatidylserine/phosphatidylglycerophosphate/cardiolipin synthase-like enzyme